MYPPDIDILIDKYLNGNATDEECRQLDKWYNSFDSAGSFTSSLNEEEIEKFRTLGLRKLRNKMD
ncbi:hypothetical protein [Flavihumibacter sp. UBA7668]|uniref:hypothetical protein n=1 Tax=Flavihumibacter sp. UBA7668 TaxID=1946542 RepID=UPI0025BEA758|nr:hypothetical protein [Flavihumibacter sp. UBA7668]